MGLRAGGRGQPGAAFPPHFCGEEGAVPRREARCQQLPLFHQARPDVLQRWSSLDSNCNVSPGHPAFLPLSLCRAEHPPASHSMTHSSVPHHRPHLQVLLPPACLNRPPANQQPPVRNPLSPGILTLSCSLASTGRNC